MPSTPLPLAGIRVLDLSRVLAGPYCGLLLSLLGAEVIKVEDKNGDESRQWPPIERDMGTPYLALNLNKKGIVVDLKSEAGKQIIRDLVGQVDILIENFKTGTMETFGLDFESLKELNPRLIYVSISAFGREGPRAKDLGYEALMQAYSGPMSMTGLPGGEPVRCGVSFLDMSTGGFSALAAMTALYQRERTGQGAKIEASLLQSALGLMTYQVASFLQDGVVQGKLGSAHPMVVPYQGYRTADGYIFIASANQNLFERFCRALGLEELIADPRYQNNAARVKHREELLERLFQAVGAIKTDDLMTRLEEAGVPCTRINDMRELMQDGQVDALGALLNIQDPDYGPLRLVGLPFFLNGAGNDGARRAPRLGEHTTEILEGLGYDAPRIASLFEENVVAGV